MGVGFPLWVLKKRYKKFGIVINFLYLCITKYNVMINSKKQNKIDYDKSIGKETEHISNKNESKLLRRLMAEHSLTKEEVLSVKKYREMLSKEQRVGQKSKLTKREKAVRDITKNITKELKLPKEHPLVVAKLKEKLDDLKSSWYWRWW